MNIISVGPIFYVGEAGFSWKVWLVPEGRNADEEEEEEEEEAEGDGDDGLSLDLNDLDVGWPYLNSQVIRAPRFLIDGTVSHCLWWLGCWVVCTWLQWSGSFRGFCAIDVQLFL